MNQEEYGKKMGQIIAKAWGDENFKQRLLGDASAVLKEEGIEVPPGLEVSVVENTDRVYHLVLPPKPSTELTDEQLDAVAGGVFSGCSIYNRDAAINCFDLSHKCMSSGYGTVYDAN